jgi:steroid delta-isomerase-like uncharacterized protein
VATEDNKALMRRSYGEVWAKGNLAVAKELVADSFVDHMPMPDQRPGRDGHNDAVLAIRGAFPDLQLSVEEILGEGDRMVGRWTMIATHSGELMGIPATGKPVELQGIDIVRIADGQIVEMWHIEDVLGLLIQIGVVPTPAA